MWLIRYNRNWGRDEDLETYGTYVDMGIKVYDGNKQINKLGCKLKDVLWVGKEGRKLLGKSGVD